MIKLKNVSIKYMPDFYSLYNCNLTIKNHTLFVGDFFDGTIAMMRIFAKIDNHYTGEYLLDGLNIKNIKDKNLNICYLPQSPVLFKSKNIFNNLYYPLKIRKINKKTAKNNINLLFNEFNLDFLNKKIKLLNISEQKIITLLRALLRKPKYIFLENFFEDLDKSFYHIAYQILTKIQSNSTIIACEKFYDNIEIYKNFDIQFLDHGSIKKESK